MLTTLVEFTLNGESNKGFRPDGLMLGSDGDFYGTTGGGGAANAGTVFKMTSGGVLTTLVEFSGNSPETFSNTAPITINDGASASPYPSIITVPTGIGNISSVRVTLKQLSHPYPSDTRFLLVSPNGTTCLLMSRVGGGYPGVSNVTLTLADDAASFVPNILAPGTYKPTTDGAIAQSMNAPAPQAPYSTQLSVFNGQSGSGNWELYVRDGETPDAGSLAGGWDLEFTHVGNGSEPEGGLVQDSDGNFYATTYFGGAANFGTIFKMTPGGVLTTLVEFTGNGASNKGTYPSPLVQGSDGDLYGTTGGGGVSNSGTVFKMTSGGVLTTLVEFTGNGASDKGRAPQSALVQDGNGNFYGTTS